MKFYESNLNYSLYKLKNNHRNSLTIIGDISYDTSKTLSGIEKHLLFCRQLRLIISSSNFPNSKVPPPSFLKYYYSMGVISSNRNLRVELTVVS